MLQLENFISFIEARGPPLLWPSPGLGCMVELRSFEEKKSRVSGGLNLEKGCQREQGVVEEKVSFSYFSVWIKSIGLFVTLSQSVRFSVRTVVSVMRKTNPRMILWKHLKNKD